jgi:protein-S-isoprenylcysteine O-methyltransferase Ste14
MVAVAVVLDVVFVVVAFGVRTVVQRRRTGDSGWRLGRPHGAAGLVARLLLVGAAGALVVSLFAPAVGGAPTIRTAGVAVAVASIVLVAVAQLQMGASWRIGVDPQERTELVTHGLYASIRNPIYTGMAAFAVGQLLMRPSPWTGAALVATWLGMEVQVRTVEEPYLWRVHGDHFSDWADRAGRFVPGIG